MEVTKTLQEWWAVILGALSIVAAAVNIGMGIYGRRKIKGEAEALEGDAAEKITDSALKLLEPYRNRVEILESMVCDLRGKGEAMGIEIVDLKLRITELERANMILSKEKTSLEKELGACYKRIEGLEKMQASNIERISAQDHRIAELEKINSALLEENGLLKERLKMEGIELSELAKKRAGERA